MKKNTVFFFQADNLANCNVSAKSINSGYSRFFYPVKLALPEGLQNTDL